MGRINTKPDDIIYSPLWVFLGNFRGRSGGYWKDYMKIFKFTTDVMINQNEGLEEELGKSGRWSGRCREMGTLIKL